MSTRTLGLVLLLVGCAPPLASSRFLSADGVGSEEEAEAYYAQLSPPVEIGEFTLFDFEDRHFGNLSLIETFYRNTSDLGFWREMRCTTRIDRARGGCLVTNWAERDQKRNLGTVGMNIDLDGHTQFYAFNAAGDLIPTVTLDSEGDKAVPRVCTSCHAGGYDVSADLRAVFREFEPSELESPTDFEELRLQDDLLALNKAILGANEAVAGAAAAEQDVRTHVAQMYLSVSPPIARRLDDPTHVPASWRGDAGREEVWRRVVLPYCMSCHRTSPIDFSSYATFEALAPLLRDYLDPSVLAHEESGLAFMPQSERQFEKLSESFPARIALGRWLGDADEPLPPIASAGPDRIVTAGDTVSIEAQHTDTSQRYRWTVGEGPYFPPVDASTFTFVAPRVVANTPMTLGLSVYDATEKWAGDEVRVVIVPDVESRTFTATDTPIPIPDNDDNGVVSIIAVDAPFDVTQATVRVDVNHTSRDDLRIEVLTPSGVSAIVDGNTVTIEAHLAQPVLGAWTLRVSDRETLHEGVLESWSLELSVVK